MRKGYLIALLALNTLMLLGTLLGVVVMASRNPSVAICPQDGEVVQEDDVRLSLDADHEHRRWLVTCTIDRDH